MTQLEALDAIIDKRDLRQRFNLLSAGKDYTFVEHEIHADGSTAQTSVLYLGQNDVRQSFALLKHWPESNKRSEVHFYNETLTSAVESEDGNNVSAANEVVITKVENIDDLTMMCPFKVFQLSEAKQTVLCLK